MPFEVRESAAVLHSTLPDNPTGVTLASARASIADPLEELRDCVATNSAPSEKLLNDLSVGFKNLYKFASLLEEAFEHTQDQHQNFWLRIITAARQMEDEADQLDQRAERARERARAAAREAREGEAREA